jgi:hypothetical protein
VAGGTLFLSLLPSLPPSLPPSLQESLINSALFLYHSVQIRRFKYASPLVRVHWP